jgi:hypothetical protein
LKERTNVSARRPQRRYIYGMLLTLLLSGLMMGPACDRAKPDSNNKTGQTTNATSNTATAQTSQTQTGGLAKMEKVEIKDVGPAAPSVIMIGGMKGYIEPCGCTLDVTAGGIDRIVEFVEVVSGFAPAHATVAAGNIWFERPSLDESEIAQATIKAEGIAKVFKHLGITAVTPGPNDFARGVDEYKRLNDLAGVKPHGLNIKIAGEALPGSVTMDLDGVKTGLVFGVEEELFEELDGVEVEPLAPKLAAEVKRLEGEGVDAIVLVYQGKLAGSKKLLEANPRIDFVLVGEEPRETDQVDAVEGGGHTLEVFDQGRYVGVLKLYDPEGGASDEDYSNARTGSKAEIEAVEAQIEHVNKSINKMPPAAPGEEPPMLVTLRERLRSLQARKKEIENSAVKLPEGKRAFIWRAVRLDEAYPEDDAFTKVLSGLNAEIDKVNRSTEFELIPPKEGEPFYVGNAQCKSCHAEAYAFWKTTNHSHALETLQKTNKDFNQDCIGCHVVGYNKPGGSVLGKLSYKAMLDGKLEIEKDLADVGCENCHGPGSKHVEAAMFGKHGKPGNFIKNLGINEQTCMASCHVPEHSPRFNYDVYRAQILGKGHGGK